MKIENVLENIYARQVRVIDGIRFNGCEVVLTRREIAAIKKAYRKAPNSVLGERLPFPGNLSLCRVMRYVVDTASWPTTL